MIKKAIKSELKNIFRTQILAEIFMCLFKIKLLYLLTTVVDDAEDLILIRGTTVIPAAFWTSGKCFPQKKLWWASLHIPMCSSCKHYDRLPITWLNCSDSVPQLSWGSNIYHTRISLHLPCRPIRTHFQNIKEYQTQTSWAVHLSRGWLTTLQLRIKRRQTWLWTIVENTDDQPNILIDHIIL